ncbi:hypothetical protein LOC72_06940 [Roseiconus lacunae]|nr:hypothetical protein [Roseiconus lacunae]
MLKKDLATWWRRKLQEIERKENELLHEKRERVLNALPQYEQCIDGWHRVKSWAQQHNDHGLIDLATCKLQDLYAEVDRTDPNSDDLSDWADALLPSDFFPATRPRRELANDDYSGCEYYYDVDTSGIAQQIATARKEDEVWRVRLKSDFSRYTLERRDDSGATSIDTFRAAANSYLEAKRRDANTGHVTKHRVSTISHHLDVICRFSSEWRPVADIDGEFLANLRHWLCDSDKRGFNRRTAKDIFATFKQWCRWMVNTAELLDTLPKNFEDAQQRITVQANAIVTLSVEDVNKALSAASGQARLYLLLGLNCGMTQKDISDLLHTEVDWEHGYITRKRSKTRNESTVPVVSYKLWPQTFELLKCRRKFNTTRVLLTESDTVLVRKSESENFDAVKLTFRSIRKKSGVKCSMSDFKKCAASLMRDHAKYNGLEGLFLGHAPKSMSDRHYTTIPKKLFEEAVTWLGSQFEIPS